MVGELAWGTAVERKQLYVFVPTVASIFWRLKRLMPKTVLKLIARRNTAAQGKK